MLENVCNNGCEMCKNNIEVLLPKEVVGLEIIDIKRKNIIPLHQPDHYLESMFPSLTIVILCMMQVQTAHFINMFTRIWNRKGKVFSGYNT